jgi:hypothetical protein
LDIVSQLNVGLDGGVDRISSNIGFQYVLVWAELEPLSVPWELWINNIPVDMIKISHYKAPIVVGQVHTSGNIFEEESGFTPGPELVFVSLNIFFQVALDTRPSRELWATQIIVILAAKYEVLSTEILFDVKTELTILLNTLFDWYLLWRWCYGWHVAINDFQLVFNIGMEWKRKTSLKERLSKCSTESIERGALNMSFGTSMELTDCKIKASDDVVATESEKLWFTIAFLFSVGVNSTILHKICNPVSGNPITLSTLFTLTWIVNVNLDS